MINEQEIKRRLENYQRGAFEKWLASPLVKMAVATIPPNEQNPEALLMLLRDAFDSGVSCGYTGMAVELINQAVQKQRGTR